MVLNDSATASIITIGEIEQELQLLNKLKSRVTGSPHHQELIAHIEQQLIDAGLQVRNDQLSFTRWTPAAERSSSLHIAGTGVPIASVFPYSGVTGPDGAAGSLVRLSGLLPAWRKARGKIAVVEVTNAEIPFSAVVGTWDGGPPWPVVANPLAAATIAGAGLARARKAGVKAVIFVWRGISDPLAHGQYLPFTFEYQDLPAVFVSGSAGRTVLAAASTEAEATLVLDYELAQNATTRTVWAVIEGTTKPDEAILVVTHTDGVNIVEENGHIAAVALARAAAKNPPERATVFVFTSGHMRIPAVTKTGQATHRFLTDHPELWAGGPGQRRAVAGLAIEHLGAREYADDPASNDFSPTGRTEPELLYATTPELAHLAREIWRAADDSPVRISRPTPLIHFGEGEPLLHAGIPAISLITTPVYLLAERPGDETALIDATAVCRQIDNFDRLYRYLSQARITNVGNAGKPSALAKAGGIGVALASIAGNKAARLLRRRSLRLWP